MHAPVDAEAVFVARMAELGVSWRWFVETGAPASGSVWALADRNGLTRDAALARVLALGQECGLDLQTAGDRVAWHLHLTGAEDVPHLTHVRAAIEATARDLRARRPALVVGGRLTPFADVAQVTGTDCLVWHLLSHVGRVPVPVTTPIDALASRQDANGLSLVRRAQAAAAVRVDATAAVDAPTAPPARDLIAQLVLFGQVERDLHRTGRLKPVVRHVETLAATLLDHLERTTGTRTDVSAVSAARRVLADALAAAGLAAPVPY